MKVDPDKPFAVVYLLYEHQYLGLLWQVSAVQLNSLGQLTLASQAIGTRTMGDFDRGLDDSDRELVALIEAIQQEYIIKKYAVKKITTQEFFSKHFESEKADKEFQKHIAQYLDRHRRQIMELLPGKLVFLMGNDGRPQGQPVQWADEPASVRFHFKRREDGTHYWATIKYEDKLLPLHGSDVQGKAWVVNSEPAYVLRNGLMHHFADGTDGNKLKPFLKKRYIEIKPEFEDNYFRKFVAPMLADHEVVAEGMDIIREQHSPQAVLQWRTVATTSQATIAIFGNDEEEQVQDVPAEMLFELYFQYGPHRFLAESAKGSFVAVEKGDNAYAFRVVERDQDWERETLSTLRANGFKISFGKLSMPVDEAYSWLALAPELPILPALVIEQPDRNDKAVFFFGKSEIKLQIREQSDWFDVYAEVHFGPYRVPFSKLRSYILQGKREFPLPNGEVAILPEAWFSRYNDLFAFAMPTDEGELLRLAKHHLVLVQQLEQQELAKVAISQKLAALQLGGTAIEAEPMPADFKGTLRPYQEAGYHWMMFLQKFNLGGCLADEMGLGKTVQTLCLLQRQKELFPGRTSLLVLPTSLIYNWMLEAKRFAKLKVLNLTGTQRVRGVGDFSYFDLVVTSYGTLRSDVSTLSQFHFHYVILDEAQAIKNPTSQVAKAVNQLKASFRLAITGTPVENNTLDLWSIMQFANPGMLGSAKFFKSRYQVPIEKKRDEKALNQLHAVIKPFMMRRTKDQVVKDLPPLEIMERYCDMSTDQKAYYDKVKSAIRNEIYQEIEKVGMAKSQIFMMSGLTKLRQIASHPSMVDEAYQGDSGKLEDVLFRLEELIADGHKILVFSSFVKHLTLMQRELKKRHIDYAYLDGATKDRQAEVDRFQKVENTPVFLISLKAGGVGLNLTAADYVFLLDPWWNPQAEKQAISRAHRIGAVKSVFVYKFITRESVEEHILQLQSFKHSLASELIKEEEEMSGNKTLNLEDLKL